jgi:nicotinate-nucleotide adenylyltransferase
MKVGLFFGTFNPSHIGQLIIANYMAECSDVEVIWFVCTPQSPFKQKKSMLSNHHRLAIANIAVDDYQKLKTSDIEFK